MDRPVERALVAVVLALPSLAGSAAAQRTRVEVETSIEAETSPIGVRHGVDGALGRYVPAERLTSRDRAVRLEAARDLGRFGPTSAVLPVLHDALAREGDREVRLELLRSIVRRASPASVTVLAEAAASGLDAEEEWAVRGLAAIGGTEAAEALVRGLSRPRPPRACADALVELGADATPALVEAARADPRALRLVEALGRIRDARAMPLLLERAAEGEAPLRAAAVAALGGLGRLEARDAVLAALADGSQLVVAAAIEALSTVGRPSDAERLVEHLHAYSPHLELALATAIVLDAPGIAPHLARLATSEDARERRAVAEAAIARPHVALLPVLEQALAVDRAGALDALASLAEGAGLPSLLALSDRDDELALAIARALRGRSDGASPAASRRIADAPRLARALARDPSVRPELVSALSSADPVERSDAARALSLLGGTGEPVREALEAETDPRAAAAFVASLEALGAAIDVRVLFRWLDDPRSYVEACGILARRAAELSPSKAHELERRLHRGLRASGADERAASALALASMGDAAAVPALVAQLEDRDPRVRLAVAHALASLPVPRGHEAIRVAARIETVPWLRTRLAGLAARPSPRPAGADDLLVLALEPAPSGPVRVVLSYPDGRVRTVVTRERWLFEPVDRAAEVFVQASDEDPDRGP